MKYRIYDIAVSMLVALFLSPAGAASTLDVRIDAARQARIGGNAADSAKALSAIVAESPQHFRARYNLGLALVAAGNDDAGLVALQEAARLGEMQGNPDPTIYNTLGWQLLQMGRTTAALEQFEKAMTFEPQLSEASRSRLLNNYGIALMQSQRYEEAEAVLRRAADEFDNASAAKSLQLVTSIRNQSGRWTVVFGGDTSMDAARDEVRKAAAAGVDNGDVVYRDGSYRSIAEFSSRGDADNALTKVLTFRSSAYVVNMADWCPDVVTEGGRKNCRR
ncbi:tetratricopeptide repeat protein [Tahibacter sp. UC22_41]|uniref:tetratricopeptide repeat protein n=1 Tax=Tahibacter sp. UC22_41 TaxID=3350178 RepID=UPI0036DD093F